MNEAFWLITGATSGVGRTLALALAQAGRSVLLTARSTHALADMVRACGPAAHGISADLGNPTSVASLIAEVQVHLAGRPLAGLIHGGGVMRWDSPLTPSGWSEVPAVNVLGPWQLIRGLETSLLMVPGSRVLMVAGDPVTLRGRRPDTRDWRQASSNQGLNQALDSAAAKVMLARVLHRRWDGRASVFAFHPGLIRSNLTAHLPWPLRWIGSLAQPFFADRCRTGEFLALDPEAPALSGNLVAGRRAAANTPFLADPAFEDAFIRSLP